MILKSEEEKLAKSRLLEEKQAKMEKQLEVDKLKMAEEQRRSLIDQPS